MDDAAIQALKAALQLFKDSQAMLKDRHDRGLVSYSEYIEQSQEILKVAAYDMFDTVMQEDL